MKKTVALVILVIITGTLLNAEIVYINKEKEELYKTPSAKEAIGEIFNTAPFEVINRVDGKVLITLTGWINEESVKTDKKYVSNKIFNLTRFSKKRIDNIYNYILNQYDEKVQFKLWFNNFGEEPIEAWSGVLAVMKKNGDAILRVRLKSTGYIVDPGKTQMLISDFQVHDFVDKDTFTYLQKATEKDLILELSKINIKTSE
ncbi:hypothetical protein ACFLR5_00495 [Elusimicrobiota bacterium]